MKQTTKEKEIELGNLSAHSEILKRNISEVNSELEKTLSLLEIKRGELKVVEDSISNLNAIKSNLLKEISEKTENLTSREKNLSRKEKDFDEFVTTRTRELDKKISNTTLQLEKDNRILRETKDAILESSNIYKTNKRLADESSSELAIIKTTKEQLISILDKKCNEKTNFLSEIDSKIIDTERQYQKVLVSLNIELEELKKIVEEEKEKVKLPAKLILEENNKLDRKRNDLTILYNRVREAWKIMYPGQNIDNVIK